MQVFESTIKNDPIFDLNSFSCPDISCATVRMENEIIRKRPAFRQLDESPT